MTTITPSYHAVRQLFPHLTVGVNFLARRVGEL